MGALIGPSDRADVTACRPGQDLLPVEAGGDEVGDGAVARRVTVGCSRSSSERGDWKERERARRLGRRTCRNQPQGDATCGRPLSSTRPDSSARTGHSVSAWLGKPGMTAGVSAAALSPRSGGLQPRPRRDRGPRARDQLWEWRRPGRRRPGRAADRRPEPGSVVAQPDVLRLVESM
jgi:hypothetical protein